MKIVMKLCLICLIIGLGLNSGKAQISMSIQPLEDACFDVIATTPATMESIQITGTPNGTVSIEAYNTNTCQGTLCFTDREVNPYTLILGGDPAVPAPDGTSVTITCSAKSLDGTRLQDGCIVVIGPNQTPPKGGG